MEQSKSNIVYNPKPRPKKKKPDRKTEQIMTMAWNYHRDAQGRNVYQVNVNSPPHHHHNHIHGPNSGFNGSCPGYILNFDH